MGGGGGNREANSVFITSSNVLLAALAPVPHLYPLMYRWNHLSRAAVLIIAGDSLATYLSSDLVWQPLYSSEQAKQNFKCATNLHENLQCMFSNPSALQIWTQVRDLLNPLTQSK